MAIKWMVRTSLWWGLLLIVTSTKHRDCLMGQHLAILITLQTLWIQTRVVWLLRGRESKHGKRQTIRVLKLLQCNLSHRLRMQHRRLDYQTWWQMRSSSIRWTKLACAIRCWRRSTKSACKVISDYETVTFLEKWKFETQLSCFIP